MSFRGMLIKAGIDSNGTDIEVFNGSLTLNKANILYFRDTDTYIYSNDDGELTIYASEELHLDIPAVDFTGGFEVTGDVVDAFVISGTESDNGIEITGVAQGSGILIDYALPTATSHAIAIATEHSLLAGTVRSVEVIQTMLVEDASVIQEALYVDIESSVMTGDWTNAIVGRVNYTAPGNANGGMVAAICSELSLMGAAQAGGMYFSLDVELECPASFTCAANAALPVAFMKFGVWGDATAIASFEDGGYLFNTDGLSAGADNLLSLTSQTLRLDIEGLARHMVLSQMQDGLGLGVSGTPMVLAADTNHAVDVFTTSPDAAGNHFANRFVHTNSVQTTGGHFAMWVQNTVGAQGAGHGCMYVKLDCGAFQAPTGGASALNVEMVMPSGAQNGGSYHPFVIDVDCIATTDLVYNAAIPISFMKLEVYGAKYDEWNECANLMTLSGIEATEDGMFEATDIDNPDFTHTARINIGNTAYYFGLSTSKAFDA